MTPAADPPATAGAPGKKSGRRFPSEPCMHAALRASIVVTLLTGIFHLVNLVEAGRAGVGPGLLTLFRLSFIISWILLAAGWILGRRLPRLDRFDAFIMLLGAVFIVRGALTPETFSATLNWVVTGAGVFFLVRFGIRSAADVRVALITLAGAAMVISAAGLLEYTFKSNPLFDSIMIDAIGIDRRVGASDQFYRIRSLVGHPGFVGAILTGSAPLALLVFWRRRWLMALSLLLLTAGLFLTFSRGSWIIGGLVLLPVVVFLERRHLRRNLKWIVLAAGIPAAIIAFDYINREEVTIDFSQPAWQEHGLHWTLGKDGPIFRGSGEADGIQTYKKFFYFDVGDGFYRGPNGPVTIIVRYFDRGSGAISIEYDAAGERQGVKDSAYTPTASFNKTDMRGWTTAAFYIEDPRFEGRQNDGADFRIVDDDSFMTLGGVTVQKGRLKLPSVVAQQWMSRADSLSIRAGLYPFAREVLKDNPLGVGIFNTPGTDHHAVDSLPLTWMMEFGWPGLLLLGILLGAVVNECRLAWKQPRTPAAVLLLALVILLLHGGHLMILYDKPSLVLMAAIAAIYANIRPWRRGGAVVRLSNQDCMV